jgi:hypothetical protein
MNSAPFRRTRSPIPAGVLETLSQFETPRIESGAPQDEGCGAF